MGEAVCIFSQLPVSGCAHCRYGTAGLPPAAADDDRGWVADEHAAMVGALERQRVQILGLQVPDWPWMAEVVQAATESSRGTGPLIEARYPGRCQGCGSRWETGDFIARDDDEDGWLCQACSERG